MLTPRRALRARKLLPTAACALASMAVQAADKDDKIVTDRPGFVESSQAVGKGRFQIETSGLLERDRNDTSSGRTWSTPTLLRYGVSDQVEMRIETDGRTVQHSTDLLSGERSTLAGYADTAVGAKWHVLDARGDGPSVGVLLHAKLPSGSRGLRGHGVRPSLRVVGEWELPGQMSLGVMPGLGIDSNDVGARYSFASFGVVLGKDFSDRLRGQAEIATPQIAHDKNGGTVANLNVGAAYLLTKNCQVDTMVSRGLTSRSPDWSWTIGLSFRL
jgi:hypothetical protein